MNRTEHVLFDGYTQQCAHGVITKQSCCLHFMCAVNVSASGCAGLFKKKHLPVCACVSELCDIEFCINNAVLYSVV